MKLIILLLTYSSLSFASQVWMTGEEKFELHPTSDDGFVSKSCLKECELKTKAEQNLKKLDEVDTTAGKDPASGYCQLIGGSVTYLKNAKDVEPFCIKGKDIISLGVLIGSLKFEIVSGKYERISGDTKLCEPGVAKIIKEDEYETFVLGPVISIPLNPVESIEKIADGNCTQTDKIHTSPSSVEYSSVISDCSKDFKKFESTTVEKVEVKGNDIHYEIKKGSEVKKCRFRRVN